MSIVYRKSLKGIDEVAFKSTGLPMRMASYLLAVDGESSVDQLAAKNPQLPSLGIVLQGLLEQGFLEVAASSANVVNMTPMRVGNGANVMSPQPAPAYAPPTRALPLPCWCRGSTASPSWRPSKAIWCVTLARCWVEMPRR